MDDELSSLENELIEFRNALAENRLTESRVWDVLQRASALADAATGTEHQPRFEYIYEMLEVVWSNTRHAARLRKSG